MEDDPTQKTLDRAVHQLPIAIKHNEINIQMSRVISANAEQVGRRWRRGRGRVPYFHDSVHLIHIGVIFFICRSVSQASGQRSGSGRSLPYLDTREMPPAARRLTAERPIQTDPPSTGTCCRIRMQIARLAA